VVLVEKHEGKTPLGRPRCRWKDNIKIELKEIEWEDMDCINVAQVSEKWHAHLNLVIKFRVPKNVGIS
jgi:hypothetical protein